MTHRPLPLLLSLLLTFAVLAVGARETSAAQSAAEGSIADLLAADPQFSMLLEALDDAGLLELLAAEEGPLTLFAPVDEAFMILPGAELDALMHDPEALLRILRYHVAEGLLVQENILAVTEMNTLEGEQVLITVGTDSETAHDLFVNEARVVGPGRLASNGVIYPIDALLLPPVPNGGGQASR